MCQEKTVARGNLNLSRWCEASAGLKSAARFEMGWKRRIRITTTEKPHGHINCIFFSY